MFESEQPPKKHQKSELHVVPVYFPSQASCPQFIAWMLDTVTVCCGTIMPLLQVVAGLGKFVSLPLLTYAFPSLVSQTTWSSYLHRDSIITPTFIEEL
jgi:hypothetical protein